jgi:hypothetical protein
MSITADPSTMDHAPRTLYIEDRLRHEIALAKERSETRQFHYNDRIFSVDGDTDLREVRMQYWRTLRCDGSVPNLGLPNVRPADAPTPLRLVA